MMKCAIMLVCLVGFSTAVLDRMSNRLDALFYLYPRCYLDREETCQQIYKLEKDFVTMFNAGQFEQLVNTFYNSESELTWAHKDYNQHKTERANELFYNLTLKKLAPGFSNWQAVINSIVLLDANTVLVKGYFEMTTADKNAETTFGTFAHELSADGKIIKKHYIKFEGQTHIF